MEAGGGSITVEPCDGNIRLDRFVSSHAGVSRNKVQQLITGGLVLVNGRPARKNHRVDPGEEITWKLPSWRPEEVIPQPIELDVVHEDSLVAVIDKPAGMVMYPGPGHQKDTLLNALLNRYPEMSCVGGMGRQGIFHRLDRDTSGLVAVALRKEAFTVMVEKIKDRQVERVYTALVSGDISADRGTIDAPMGRSKGNRKKMAVERNAGRRAVSHFEVKERFNQGFNLVEVSLETGRTHQIRVHFAHVGHPVVGDREYSGARTGKQLGLERQFLHACRLGFTHPETGEPLQFHSGLPKDLTEALRLLRSK
ncbi:MAG: RluA family pseudouridine synthase [Actinobacteria bacterium]|nr:RluA family pseudouridine synthase [Actinomycetota bacterium]MBU4302285.1 RluA family pseudouridine synthase [Actinomycetota bacterium]MBU4489243.1 RluA family pseudouridine synthase [Actinomycetota bacterium]MCG2795143.1 RluA family pseudouridine synthase [Actinomycetes bacterium]